MRNEFGRVDDRRDAAGGGRFEQPRISGDLTIAPGTLRVDEILARTLFQPYATEPTSRSSTPIRSPRSIRGSASASTSRCTCPARCKLLGENVQVSSGTPIGLGDINLTRHRRPLPVQGSGAAAFRHRIVRSDPRHLRVSGTPVRRGADQLDQLPRRSQSGAVRDRDTRHPGRRDARQHLRRDASSRSCGWPARRRSIASDILSLIVFNTSVNELSAPQQQQLLVRAGTLAAGFLAGQVLSTIQSKFGLDILELETSAISAAGRSSRSATRSRQAWSHGSAASSDRSRTTRRRSSTTSRASSACARPSPTRRR